MTTLEFAGLPGSGKSRWAEYAASQLRAEGAEAWLPRASLNRPLAVRSGDKLWSVGRAVSHSPVASIDAMRAVWASQGSQIERLRRSLQWLDTQGRLAKRGPEATYLIMDEGPLQALWSIGLEGEWEPVLEAVERRGYLRAHCVVVLHVSPEVALSRLEARAEGHRRIDRLASRREKLNALERGADLLRALVGEWTDRYGEDSVAQVEADDRGVVAQRIRDVVLRPLKA